MGHEWASDVAHSNIHEHYLFTSLFNLYKNTEVSIDSHNGDPFSLFANLMPVHVHNLQTYEIWLVYI